MSTPTVPVPAASLLLLRSGESGLEVFMVGRPPSGAFPSALVFPGGKLALEDGTPEILARCEGRSGLKDQDAAHRVAAIREAFEEAGILLARREGAMAFIAAEVEHLAQERRRLAAEALSFRQFLTDAGLYLALDALVPFAHWITPALMRRRFDTRFFVAAAPQDQVGAHVGGELVSSGWFAPRQTLDLAEAGIAKLMFPTRMNLLRLLEAPTVDAALEAARSRPVVTVEPIITQRDGRFYSTIPAAAGYPGTDHLLDGTDA